MLVQVVNSDEEIPEISTAYSNDPIISVMTEELYETCAKILHKVIINHVSFIAKDFLRSIGDLFHEALAISFVCNEQVITYLSAFSDLFPRLFAVFLGQVVLYTFQ